MAKDSQVELKKGFRDVYFDRTTTSLIVGKPGKLLYRGYSIDDLAEHSTFEETSYLLLYGALPTSTQLDCFTSDLKASRSLPEEVLQIIDLTKAAHPMDVYGRQYRCWDCPTRTENGRDAGGRTSQGCEDDGGSPHHRCGPPSAPLRE